MTVIDPPLPPSRAGAVALIAGDLALNFANAESGRGFPSRQDHLQAPAHVADWLQHAGALDPAAAAELRARLAADPAFAEALLVEARRLRDDVHAVAAAIARRAEPPRAALDDLAALYARWLAAARLAPDGARHGWRWRVRRRAARRCVGAGRARRGVAGRRTRSRTDQRMRRRRLRLAVL